MLKQPFVKFSVIWVLTKDDVVAHEDTLQKKPKTTMALFYFSFLSDIWADPLPLSRVAMTISLEKTENKQGFEWQVDALRRQSGRGWQAAVTVVLLPHKLLLLVKLQASPGWPLLHVLLHSISIHSFIDLSIFSSPWLLLSDFFLLYASPSSHLL